MSRSTPIGVSLTAALITITALPVSAWSQYQDDEPRTDEQTTGESDKIVPDADDETIGGGEPSRELPPPTDSNEPLPTPSGLEKPRAGIVKQAGVGSDVAFARAGVLELGGSMNFTGASDFTNLSIAPSLGWFFTDNLELSAIMRLSHISAQGVEANFFSALAEPSLHIPLNEAVFVFGGLGAGISWVDGPGFGFALAPRVGLNVMIGRSGILTPQLLLQYATHEAISTPEGALLAVSVSYGAGIGYTVMW